MDQEYQGGALRALESGTYNKDEGELLWWPYYDTVVLAAATTNHAFFATPLGQAGKGLETTNFPAANQMPQAQNFEIKAFELYYIPDAAKTQAEYQLVIDAFRTAWFEFSVFNKAPSVQIPLTIFMGATFPLVVTGAAAGDQVMGRSQYSGVWESPIEIPLGAKANFNCDIAFSGAHSDTMDGDKIQLAMVGGLVRL